MKASPLKGANPAICLSDNITSQSTELRFSTTRLVRPTRR